MGQSFADEEARMNQMAGTMMLGDKSGVECTGRGTAAAVGAGGRSTSTRGEHVANLVSIPLEVKASAAPTLGVYDARRLRSQREIIRDVMLSAAECDTWLTLGELRALTRYGEASISAQLRHLRKTENGGYEVVKRHRHGASLERPGVDGRGECVWEYQIPRGAAAGTEVRQEIGAASA